MTVEAKLLRFEFVECEIYSHLFVLLSDDDEPYSPGGSEDEDTAMDTNPVVAPAAPLVVPSELQKEVERLNRQIEAQKNEIVEMLAKDPLVST